MELYRLWPRRRTSDLAEIKNLKCKSSFCVRPCIKDDPYYPNGRIIHLPYGDWALITKLIIETNESRFIKTAVRRNVATRLIDWLV